MYKPSKQEQFNYGFQDGLLQFSQGFPYRYEHFDKNYLRGWQAGYAHGQLTITRRGT